MGAKSMQPFLNKNFFYIESVIPNGLVTRIDQTVPGTGTISVPKIKL